MQKGLSSLPLWLFFHSKYNQAVNTKWLYLLLYSIALRILSLSIVVVHTIQIDHFLSYSRQDLFLCGVLGDSKTGSVSKLSAGQRGSTYFSDT